MAAFAAGAVWMAAWPSPSPADPLPSATPRVPAPPTPVVVHSSQNDTSPPLRDIRARPPRAPALDVMPPLRRRLPARPAAARSRDPVVQSGPTLAAMPAAAPNFEGLSNADNNATIGEMPVPPDTNGDIGPNHYVQITNLIFAVYDRIGNIAAGFPKANNAVFAGFGGPCENTNDGDPIVLYDHLANKWFLSQFSLPNLPDGPFHQCIAVSKTGDPRGDWHRYRFKWSNNKLNDYPKFGVWPNGYYMSVNQFNRRGGFVGVGVAAFQRKKMLRGRRAKMIKFNLRNRPALYSMLPSDLDGAKPPKGAPNYFAQIDDDTFQGIPDDRIVVLEFKAKWRRPRKSTFGNRRVIRTANFNSVVCNDVQFRCIPQPSPGRELDALYDRLMHRLQYRNLGNRAAMVLNHTVRVSGARAGIRWYELKKRHGKKWRIRQQGTYAGDGANGAHRWMGSIAMNGDRDIALGYSVSSENTFPSIRYVGRVRGDEKGKLPRGEQSLVIGGGAQLSGGQGRWGDYSMMAVDPMGDCKFWYTQEYYASNSPRGWQTRIGAFEPPGGC